MTKFEEEFNYLIELSGKVLLRQVDAETFEKNRISFFEKYQTDQQQALPVVPDFIGKLINTFGAPEDGKYINYSASYLENQKELDWIDNHQKTWLTALIIGFRVEKPQLFYLKNKLTGKYLRSYTGLSMDDTTLRYEEVKDERVGGFGGGTTFTQLEIDSMQTGSYEQIEVAE